MNISRSTSSIRRFRFPAIALIAMIAAAAIGAAAFSADARRPISLLPRLPPAAAGPLSFLRRPAIHGDQIAFTSEGDLWLASAATGFARRITTHNGQETNARFSPDGRTLAFNAQYEGGTDIYVMPCEGGTPKRLTWDPRVGRVVGWTPDGASILFLSRRANPENVQRLWRVPVRGGIPTLLPLPRAALAAMAPDGKRVAFVPVSAEWQNWKQYQGGQADDIWLTDISDAASSASPPTSASIRPRSGRETIYSSSPNGRDWRIYIG